MKRLINRKIILLSSTLIVLLITLVTVTVAWFRANVNVNADANDLHIADMDFLVSLTEGGTAVTDTDKILLNVKNFKNVKSGMLAPGTSGAFDLYITSNSEVTTDYQVGIDTSQLTLIVPPTEPEGTETDYSTILREHIKFYTLDNTDNKVYIDDSNPATGALELGIEKKVTIYWEWPYEADTTAIVNPADKKAAIDTYDKEDTILGKYNDHIAGQIVIHVNGVQAVPEP